jgi:hypothetical protein
VDFIVNDNRFPLFSICLYRCKHNPNALLDEIATDAPLRFGERRQAGAPDLICVGATTSEG